MENYLGDHVQDIWLDLSYWNELIGRLISHKSCYISSFFFESVTNHFFLISDVLASVSRVTWGIPITQVPATTYAQTASAYRLPQARSNGKIWSILPTWNQRFGSIIFFTYSDPIKKPTADPDPGKSTSNCVKTQKEIFLRI